MVLIVLPGITYFSTQKNYKANQRISEQIEYKFHQDNFETVGESFQSVLSWNKIHKVNKTKNWLLIW